jgi:hypothetical protein
MAGTSTTITKSFSSSSSYTFGIDVGILSGSLAGDYKSTSSTSNTESITKISSLDISSINPASSSNCNFIDHDYDIIDIWLNPQVKIKSTGINQGMFNTISDVRDTYIPLVNGQAQVDHIAVRAGWLNGNLPWPADDTLTRLSRTWDTQNPTPGLTTADYAAILALDPWVQQIDPNTGAKLPLASNTDINNVTMHKAGAGPRYSFINSVGYTPVMQTTRGVLSNTTADSTTNTYSETYGVSYGGKSGFIAGLSSNSTFNWTYTVSDSVSSSLTNTATYSIVTPDGSKSMPSATSVDIWQDNLFNTFLFVFPGGGF